MPKDFDIPADLNAVVGDWLAAFEVALADGGRKAADLFADNGHWRDILSFTWHIRTFSGHEAIAAGLAETLDRVQPKNFRIAPDRWPPRAVMRAGRDCIEAFYEFETSVGTGNGVLRLVPGENGWRAWILVTALFELAGHAEHLGLRKAGGDAFSREWGGRNWQDLRDEARAYKDRDPAVLVVGGGQAGLGAAARLTHLGVDTLIVDKHARIGDNWRSRYHSLTLHNETQVNHLPYMPFPPTWPTYIPKDMLANWFEAYVEALELNYWTGTTLTKGHYDDTAGCWNVTLERDGGTRTMRPRHIVMATGVSAIPIMPDLPGLSEFAGTVMHSGGYSDGKAWKGKRALIIGTGNSAHDVAQDLHASGAKVTMVQRASTHIVSLAEAQRVYMIYNEGPPTRDCDLLATATPYPELVKAYRHATQISKEADKDLLDGLEKAGFRLNDGVDDCGFQMSYLQRGGGYYFNVGCSELIAAGEIGLLDYADFETFEAAGARLKDASLIEADLVVLATGYKNQQETARAFLGDDVADKIGPVWGFGEDGELCNMWKRTPQPGLWFTAGSLAQCRIYSRFLALQIKACEEGLISPER
jgi:thioredoxin reductase